MHLAVAADDGVRMAAMQIKRVDFNWATAGSNLYLVSELAGVAAMPTRLPKTLKVVPAPLVEAVPRAPPALELPNPYGRIYMRQLWCRPDACGRRKSLSSRDPLQLLRLVQFDRRLTPFNPCYAAAG